LNFRAILKTEIDAATGVVDMQRGQALSGERTRYEVRQFADMSGTQGRHFRTKFTRFIASVVRKTRAIGAKYDTARRVISLENYGVIDTQDYPVRPFLEQDLPLNIDPTGQSWKDEDQLKQEAMMEWKEAILPGIQLRTIDPQKGMRWLLRNLGHGNPDQEFFFSAVQQISEVAPEGETAVA
jgi:hypothetical protein